MKVSCNKAVAEAGTLPPGKLPCTVNRLLTMSMIESSSGDMKATFRTASASMWIATQFLIAGEFTQAWEYFDRVAGIGRIINNWTLQSDGLTAQVMKFQCEEEAAVSAIEQVCSKALFLAEKHRDIFLMAAATQAQGNLLTSSGCIPHFEKSRQLWLALLKAAKGQQSPHVPKLAQEYLKLLLSLARAYALVTKHDLAEARLLEAFQYSNMAKSQQHQTACAAGSSQQL